MMQMAFEVEIVLLRTLWVKRNAGKGTPALCHQNAVRGGRIRPRPHADGLTGSTREIKENGTPVGQPQKVSCSFWNRALSVFINSIVSIIMPFTRFADFLVIFLFSELFRHNRNIKYSVNAGCICDTFNIFCFIIYKWTFCILTVFHTPTAFQIHPILFLTGFIPKISSVSYCIISDVVAFG